MLKERIEKLVAAGYSKCLAFSIELGNPDIESISFEEIQWMWGEITEPDSNKRFKILKLAMEKAETFKQAKWLWERTKQLKQVKFILEQARLFGIEESQIVELMIIKAETIEEFLWLWESLDVSSPKKSEVFEILQKKAKEVK